MPVVQKDYIMRIIHEMVRTILKLIFHIDEAEEEELVFLEGKNQDLFRRLCVLADSGKINEAENLLYENIEEENAAGETWEGEKGNLENLKLSLAFYDYLNTKDNDFLEEHDYSREEIGEGIKAVMKMYGYGGLAETLLENR